MLFSLLGFRFSFLVLGLGLGILLHCEVASELLCPDERDMHKNPPAPAFFGEINTLHFEGLALHLLGPGRGYLCPSGAGSFRRAGALLHGGRFRCGFRLELELLGLGLGRRVDLALVPGSLGLDRLNLRRLLAGARRSGYFERSGVRCKAEAADSAKLPKLHLERAGAVESRLSRG